MLPESKTDFPKFLYLDQCKWIDLARAHYGRPDGEPFNEALEAVRAATAHGKVVAPFCAINAVEAMQSRDSDRRERLARFMVDLSGNHSVLHCLAVLPHELKNAVRSVLGRPVRPLRGFLVEKGLFNAFGGRLHIEGSTPETNAAALAYSHMPEMTVRLLLDAAEDRERIENSRAEEAKLTARSEQVRAAAAADLTPLQRRGYELAAFLRDQSVRTQVMVELQKAGARFDDFMAKFQTLEGVGRFFEAMPTLGAQLDLTLARDRDLKRRIHPNDVRDLYWLGIAVPYSNLMVAENYWGHHVKAAGLDAKYGTTVTTDARELPRQLAALGCL